MLDKLPSGVDAVAGASAQGQTSLAVLIVGMHRSGTSALSGVLNLLGVAVPEDLHPADEHNQKGYFEPARIINFHEALLKQLGSPSNDPLPLTYDWVRSPVGQAAAETLADILDEEFGGKAMCLFKDPRICRLMPVWSAALARSGRGGVAILPYRHPLEVAGSLAAKAGLGRAYALFMWLQHVLLGERFTRAMPRSFVAYDALMGDWRAAADKLQRELGVAWPHDVMRAGVEIDAFLSGELRHHQSRAETIAPHDPLDALCSRTWTALHRLNAAPYDAEAMAEMDAVWAEFEAANGVFGPLVVTYQRDLDSVRENLHDTLSAVEALTRTKDAERETDIRIRDEEIRRRDRRIVELEKARQTARDRLAVRERDLDWAMKNLHEREAALSVVSARASAIENSTSWKLATVLRSPFERHPGLRRLVRGTLKVGWWAATLKVGRKLREREAIMNGAAPPPLVHASAGAAPVQLAAQVREGRSAVPHIAFLSGEPDTPGHVYRVQRWAEAARAAGATTSIARLDEIPARLPEFAKADLIYIWRALWDDRVAQVVEPAKRAGTPILFDIDDLLMEPDQAKSEVIDGIRSQKFAEASVRTHFELVERTFLAADYCSAPTEMLAHRLRRHAHPAFVLPNGFDEAVRLRSRLAARRRREEGSDGLIRIGYATGSKTHQKDFAQAAEGVAQILREYPQTRLVLFRLKSVDVLDIGEFPSFDGLADQIEWRDIVPVEQLPDELARFDINLAPLEVGNLFCESKSELKYFEAALVDVPTVASPTEPYRKAIRHGETGFLASTSDEWYGAIRRLVEEPGLRAKVAKAAQDDSIAQYGPERRVELFASVMEQVLGRGRRAARAFELDLTRRFRPRPGLPHVPPHEVLFQSDQLSPSEVTVIIPLYNYAGYVGEALDSVAAQTLKDIDLIVVDDRSTDDSLEVAERWIETNRDRFGRVMLIRNVENSGLAFTRNVGFSHADTPFVLPLDADNRLLPTCAERLVEAAKPSVAAFAYPQIRQFGDGSAVVGQPYDPGRFVIANYIDAMALIRRSAWIAAGGYDHVRYGWEDFDLWCRLVEIGMFGEYVAEPLAEYRVHQSSMLRSETDEIRNKLRLVKDIERRHPWLHIDRDPPSGPKLPDDETEA